MKILVTGGAGFVGSHLVDELVIRGHSLMVLDDLSTGRLENLARHRNSSQVRFVQGSILDAEVVDECVSQCDAVIHMAAAVGVSLIVKDPIAGIETNIRGSETVLEACNRHRRKVLIASTSEIYGKNTSDALNEECDRILGSPLKARWSYSEAKAIEELMAYSYWQTNGLPVVIVRLFNTVGPRQLGHYGMVIPRLVGQALRGEELTIYGTGTQTRCFCHVSDVSRGILDLFFNESAEGQVFNMGSQDEISMNDLANQILRVTKSSSKIRHLNYKEIYDDGFEDMQRRRPDIAKIRQFVGWQPKRTLEEIIQDVSQDLLELP